MIRAVEFGMDCSTARRTIHGTISDNIFCFAVLSDIERLPMAKVAFHERNILPMVVMDPDTIIWCVHISARQRCTRSC